MPQAKFVQCRIEKEWQMHMLHADQKIKEQRKRASLIGIWGIVEFANLCCEQL